MIAKRYRNDGKPTVHLNELQLQMKRQIEDKVAAGIYSFEEVPCCVCGGTDFQTLSEKDRYGLSHSVVICRECGLIQANPRMTQDSYQRFYESEYRKLYGGQPRPTSGFFDSQHRRGERIYNYITENLGGPRANLLVVEVGCAAGGILQYFREKGHDVYGVDLDPEYTDFGKKRYGLNIEVGTVDKLAELDRKPDIVIYSHVLEHILDPVTELMKLEEALTRESVLYIEVPSVSNVSKLKGYYGDFLKFIIVPHVYYFTLTALKTLLSKAGYELVCGDEVIHSVFTKRGEGSAAFQYHSDYQDSVVFLRKLESSRLLRAPRKLGASLTRQLVRLASKVLKALRLYSLARRLYHRIR